jgi:hypothetical protein
MEIHFDTEILMSDKEEKYVLEMIYLLQHYKNVETAIIISLSLNSKKQISKTYNYNRVLNCMF